MQLGVCYYPEHWPQDRWPLDAELMRQAGISLVRIAEFAWVAMEPREGEFTWNWLDQAIEVLAAEGLQVILGTPTASPPPWLSRAHPGILPVDAQGRRRRFGSRLSQQRELPPAHGAHRHGDGLPLRESPCRRERVYNTIRPHHSLGRKPPAQYLRECFPNLALAT
jgi:hypothetical protein